MLSNGKIRRAPTRRCERVASDDCGVAPARPGRVPIILDIEASGFGRGSYPIEVGLVFPDGKSHCFLIAPEPNWKRWDVAAEAVHGIKRDTLLRHGQSVRDIAWRLNALLADQKAYSDAWSFDLSWIGLLFDAAGVSQRFRVNSIRELLSDHQLEVWHETRDKVVRELGLQRHRASSDARILRETLIRVQRRRIAQLV